MRALLIAPASRCALVTASLALLLVLAPAARGQGAIDRAAEALRSDPVYVAPGAESILSASGEDAVEQRIAERDPGPLYIAVLPDEARNEAGGSAGEVAAGIARQTGREGTYAVIVGNEFRAGPSEAARDAADAAVEAGGNGEDVLVSFVDELADPGSTGGGGDGSGAGGLIVLGLVGAGGAALLVSRRRKRREQEAEFAEVKDNARDDLVALGDDIRALDLDIEMPNTPAAARADYERAVNAYDRADSAWEVARTPEDLEPVGAALEEGRWAMTSARARLEGREPPERRSPCFFDPRHGPSSREVMWAPEYGEPRPVPACEADAQRVELGEDPHAREVMIGGRRVPYWNAGPMYAPFAGGFFGTGLLPGLMLGTMLGSAWDTDPMIGGDFGGGDFGAGDFGGGDFGGGDFGGGDF